MSAFGSYTCEFCGVTFHDVYPNPEEHVCKISDLKDMIIKLLMEVEYLQEQLEKERRRINAI